MYDKAARLSVSHITASTTTGASINRLTGTVLQSRGDRPSTGYLQVTLSSKGGVTDYQQAICKSHFPPKEGWQTITRLSTSHTFLQGRDDRLLPGYLQVTLSSKVGMTDYYQAICKSQFPPNEGWQTITRLSTRHNFLQRRGNRLLPGYLQVTRKIHFSSKSLFEPTSLTNWRIISNSYRTSF